MADRVEPEPLVARLTAAGSPPYSSAPSSPRGATTSPSCNCGATSSQNGGRCRLQPTPAGGVRDLGLCTVDRRRDRCGGGDRFTTAPIVLVPLALLLVGGAIWHQGMIGTVNGLNLASHLPQVGAVVSAIGLAVAWSRAAGSASPVDTV